MKTKFQYGYLGGLIYAYRNGESYYFQPNDSSLYRSFTDNLLEPLEDYPIITLKECAKHFRMRKIVINWKKKTWSGKQ